MIYQAYQAYSDLTDTLRYFARVTLPFLDAPWPGSEPGPLARKLAASLEVFARTGLTHVRRDFGIERVRLGGPAGAELEVEEVVADRTPFCSLLHFRKSAAAAQPRVLLVTPMSGHFATLLRGTVRTMLPDHDVYITDWHNARDISRQDGRFDLGDYTDHLIRFLGVIGSGAHMVAVCQPTVPALAAVALMAAENHPAQAASLTLMAGPIDTRVNPTEVNKLAMGKPISWFEQNLVGTVPLRYKGALRRVYPGFLQLTAFMAMNLDRHVAAFKDLHTHLLNSDTAQAASIKTFYEEYFAMADLPAEFYLETVARVFQQHDLARGMLSFRGRLVDPRTIRRTALFTVEGEKDDICAVGQTLAAQELCGAIRPYMRRHHVQTGVGHYGVFNGRRWNSDIYPLLRDFIHASD